mgnify:CR=1 FL=1
MNILGILKFGLRQTKPAQKAIETTLNPFRIYEATGRRMITPLKSFKGNPADLSYVPKFELGSEVNSGIEAVVYNVKGYKDLVARVKKGTTFDYLKLRRFEDEAKHTVAKSPDGKITIMRKIEGEPLYGKGWNIRQKPKTEDFERTLDKLEQMPDSTYSQLIDDVIDLRKKGYDIDKINPNNFLLDTKKQKINIVDISKNSQGHNGVELDDIIEPLLDDRRIMYLDRLDEKVISKVKSFIDRIISVGRAKNLGFTMERLDHSKLQTNLVYLYHNDQLMINSIRH